MNWKSRLNANIKNPACLLSVLFGIVLFCVAFFEPEFPVLASPYAPAPAVSIPVVPVTPVTPRFPFTPPVVVPTDVESTLPSFPGNYPALSNIGPLSSPALNGIKLIDDNDFPHIEVLSGETSGISIKKTDGTVYEKVGSFVVKLVKGEILVSVKRPSQTAMIQIPLLGAISVTANGDVIVKFVDGVLRVLNLDGTGQSIKVQLNRGPFAGDADPTVAVAPGFELIAGDKKLTRAELRPKDGIARRHFKVLENGHLAISEISVESVLNASDVIADFRQKVSGVKERRILSDMSKMAAVLNHTNGTQGFTVEE